MSPRVPTLAVVLLALLAAATASVAAGGGVAGSVAVDGAAAGDGPAADGPAADGPAGQVAAQETTPTNGTLPSEETVVDVQLEPDGDARWVITERVVITDEYEREAFDDLAEDFEARTAGSLGLDTFREGAQRAVEHADRDMRITAANHTATRENGSLADTRYLNGTFRLEFRWVNFSRVVAEDEDEDIATYAVDDAFNTSAGTWFPGLTSDERLVVRFPDRATTIDTPTQVEGRAMEWTGPVEFPPGHLTTVYRTPTNPAGNVSSIVWAALAIAGLALLVAAWLLARRRGVDPAAVLGAPGTEDEAADEHAEEAGATDEATDEDAEDGEDLALLSDEERVERLLEINGGRMKQANIVKETGWSNAKVSQLLSSMEEEGHITKLRIGRENLIAFPDEDVGEFET